MDIVSYMLGKKAGGGSPTPVVLQDKSVNITQNGSQTITADDGYDGLNSVAVTTKVSEIVKDVIFYDYDGTELYTYTKNEFLALTSLPASPTHTGLTFQSWTYTLQQAKDYVTKYGVLDIGAIYITDDGYTRIYIDNSNYNNIEMTLSFKFEGEVQINWGDNTELDDIENDDITSAITKSHTYTTGGKYTIEIRPIGETNILLTLDLFTSNSGADNYFIYKIEVGEKVYTVSGSSSSSPKLNSLKSVTIPNGVVNVMFIINANVLKCIVLPTTVTDIPNTTYFKDNFNLTNICIPYGVTRVIITDGGLWNLKSLTIPDTATSINIGNNSQVPKSLTRLVVPTSSTSGQLVLSYSPIKYLYVKGGTYNINSNYARTLKELIFDADVSLTLSGTSGNPFQGTLSMEKLKLPKNISSLNFNYLSYNLKVLDMTNYDYIPTLSNAGSQLQQQAKQCKIVVPDSMYNAYISNWSSVASRIVKASEYTE